MEIVEPAENLQSWAVNQEDGCLYQQWSYLSNAAKQSEPALVTWKSREGVSPPMESSLQSYRTHHYDRHRMVPSEESSTRRLNLLSPGKSESHSAVKKEKEQKQRKKNQIRKKSTTVASGQFCQATVDNVPSNDDRIEVFHNS